MRGGRRGSWTPGDSRAEAEAGLEGEGTVGRKQKLAPQVGPARGGKPVGSLEDQAAFAGGCTVVGTDREAAETPGALALAEEMAVGQEVAGSGGAAGQGQTQGQGPGESAVAVAEWGHPGELLAAAYTEGRGPCGGQGQECTRLTQEPAGGELVAEALADLEWVRSLEWESGCCPQ